MARIGRAGVHIVFNHFPQLASQLQRDTSTVVRKVTIDVAADAVQSMSGMKSGRTYRVPGTTAHYRASRPGQAPAMPTGTLANSINTMFPKLSQGLVYTNDEIAPHMEYGTVHIAPRPFLKPAAEKHRPVFNAAMKVVIGRLARTR